MDCLRFAHAHCKQCRTRCFDSTALMPFTADAVISPASQIKNASLTECVVFLRWWWEMDQLFNFPQPSYSSQLANVDQLTASIHAPRCGIIVEQNFSLTTLQDNTLLLLFQASQYNLFPLSVRLYIGKKCFFP